MVANNYKETITIKSPPTAVDSWGARSGSYTTVATKRAQVKQLSATTFEAANQLYSSAQWMVETRYDSSITVKENYQIIWGSITLEIGSIENLNESNRVWRFTCSEVKSE